MELNEYPTEVLNDADQKKYRAKVKRILPYLALNEVFIGETQSARVSHLHIQINNQNILNKTKSSGLCVSTGTGSSSWLTRYVDQMIWFCFFFAFHFNCTNHLNFLFCF